MPVFKRCAAAMPSADKAIDGVQIPENEVERLGLLRFVKNADEETLSNISCKFSSLSMNKLGQLNSSDGEVDVGNAVMQGDVS